MLRINEDIKNGEFQKMYLLCGEEDYLRFQFRDKLVKALVNEGDTMNFTRISGKDISIPQIIDLAETLPFFADRRVILLEDTGLFKASCDPLTEYLASPSETTVFLFCEQSVDRRSKLYKTIEKQGHVAEFIRQDEKALASWMNKKLAERGKSFASHALFDYLLKRVGQDMLTLVNELEKVIDYVGDRDVIERQDIDALCTPQTQDMVYDMLREMSSGRKKEAMQCYYEMLLFHKQAMQTLFQINRQVNQLLQAKELMLKRADSKQIAADMGVSPWAAKKILELASIYSREDLQKMLELGISTETDIKVGNLQDNIGVEMLIIRFSDIASASLQKRNRRRS